MIETIPQKAWTEGDLPGVMTNELEATLDQRLVEGQHKYGNSWCEVDLKTDLLEELWDALNYLRFAAAREAEVTGVMELFYADMLGYLQGYIAQIERRMPDFAGPTSNEWVKRLVLDDGTV